MFGKISPCEVLSSKRFITIARPSLQGNSSL